MKIKKIMSTPVVVTREKTKLKHTRNLFSRKSINAIPVLKEDGEIAGILSASDLAKAHDDDICVSDIMTKKVHIVVKKNRVKDAAKKMLKHNVHHLVVMKDGHVVGMVSSLDIIASFLK